MLFQAMGGVVPAHSSFSRPLRLLNRTTWHITADAGSLPLAEDLCRILRLNPTPPEPGSRLLLICRREGAPRNAKLICLPAAALAHGLPRERWTSDNHGALRLWSHKERSEVICEIVGGSDNRDLDIIRMQLMLKAVYDRVRQQGGFVLHAALVEYEAAGILLAGRGCAGKSTCCRRLPGTWKVLCDDQVLVLPHGSGYMAHPLPTWSEHFAGNTWLSWDIEAHVPIAAVFFVEQSPSDAVLPLGQGRAASYVTQLTTEVMSSTWSQRESADGASLRNGLFQDACAFSKRVPAYQLKVSLDGAFWEEIERVLTQSKRLRRNGISTEGRLGSEIM